MAKRVAIVQSNYVPWKGYFDLIGMVDEFVLLDDAQFTKRDWRNRNLIKTASGSQWLTIPVQVSGRYHQRIDETQIADASWAGRHWETLRHAYSRARFFPWASELLEPLYGDSGAEPLSVVNRRFLVRICEALGITTQLSWSTDYCANGASTDRLVDLCVQSGASEYLSGPAARAYLDESIFAAAGVTVTWMDYEGYAEYPQLHPPFDHRVSIVDLLFNVGPDASAYALRRALAS